MSTISTIHTSIVHAAKGPNKSVALFGQRGVVTIAKASRDPETKQLFYGQHLQQTMFTSIPRIDKTAINWNDSQLQNHLVEYLESVQNSIIGDALKSGCKEHTDSSLGVSSIIAYLETTNSPEKWDASKIASWFDGTLAEIIGVALIEKGFTDVQLEKSLVAYSKLFADTFSSKAAIPKNKAIAIQKALTLTVGSEIENDAQVCKFKARIAKTLEEQNIDELLGL